MERYYMVVNDPFVSDPNKLLCVDDEVNMLNITRKRKTTHPVYPNYDFLQVEEINQVIYNMTHHGFVSVASIDTSAIFKKFWSDDKYYAKNSYCTFKDVNYNFTNVSFTNKESGTIWRFEVRNKLWNGTWRIDTNENVKYKVVTPNEHNGNILEIQSTRGKFENNKWQYDPVFCISHDVQGTRQSDISSKLRIIKSYSVHKPTAQSIVQSVNKHLL